MRLDINYRKKICKKYEHMEAKQYATNQPRDHWKNQKIPRNNMDLIDIYRSFHPKTTEYTFFSSAHGTFSRIDHI